MVTTVVNIPAKPVLAPRFSAEIAGFAFRVFSLFERSRAAREQRAAQRARHVDSTRLREYAQQVARHDARFAADLFAAADRHERQGA